MDQKETFSLPITFMNSLQYSGVQKRTDEGLKVPSRDEWNDWVYCIKQHQIQERDTVNYQSQTMQSHGVFRHYKHVTPDTKTTINNQQITNIFISTPNSFIYTLCPLFLSIDNRFECSYFVNFVKFWYYKIEVYMKKNWK